jgi:hypothetical protein
MDETHPATQDETQCESRRIVGRPFLPGDANPKGRRSTWSKIDAEAALQAARFEARHGRPPTEGELSAIVDLADSLVHSRRDLPAEDRVKYARLSELRKRKLGLDGLDPTPSTSDRLSGRAALAAMIKREAAE